MKDKRQLYFFCTKLPWPLDSGQNLRAFHLLKNFSIYFNLNLICISDDVSFSKEIQKRIKFKSIKVIKQNKLNMMIGIIFGFLCLRPIQVSRFTSLEMKKEVKKIKDMKGVFFFHLDRAAQYGNLIKSNEKYLDMCDVSSKRYLQNFKNLDFFNYKKWVFLYEFYAAKISENYYPKKFKKTFLHSEREVQEKNIFFKKNVFIQSTMGFSNDIENNLWSKESKKIIFLGTLNYYPNLSGVVWFIENVLVNFEDYELHIVGSIDKKVKSNLENNPQVICHGFVSNVESLDLRFSFGISPIFSAAGIQNKIVDYISFGIPIIATEESMQGFSKRVMKEVNIANSKNDWLKILGSQDNIKYNSSYLKKCIYEEHSWSTITHKIIKEIDDNH